MRIAVELPDDIARHPGPGREALEALAIEGYAPNNSPIARPPACSA